MRLRTASFQSSGNNHALSWEPMICFRKAAKMRAAGSAKIGFPVMGPGTLDISPVREWELMRRRCFCWRWRSVMVHYQGGVLGRALKMMAQVTDVLWFGAEAETLIACVRKSGIRPIVFLFLKGFQSPVVTLMNVFKTSGGELEN